VAVSVKGGARRSGDDQQALAGEVMTRDTLHVCAVLALIILAMSIAENYL